MRVAILAKSRTPRAVQAASRLHRRLVDGGHEVALDAETAEMAKLPGGLPKDELAAGRDLAIVLGGDGTLLHGARLFSPHSVPIYGINLGRLGFLSDTDAEHGLEQLERVLRGEYTEQKRLMLSGEVLRADGTRTGPFHALNDFVVNKGALAQVVRLSTHVDDDFVSSYLADGLIIATPTGSTAYGLAAGGPIVVPSTQVILLAPICPHILTNRPLIVSADSKVVCTLVEARDECFLTIDGQEGVRLTPGDRIAVRRSEFSARLVQTDSADFFAILRSKLGWGTPQSGG